MPDPKKLPFLLKLLDDESKIVQESILKEFLAYGGELEKELAGLGQPMSEDQRQKLKNLFQDYSRDWIKKNWKSWYVLQDDSEKLETALALLAEYQNGPLYPVKLKALLDELAMQYDAFHQTRDVSKLAGFLFKVRGIKGAPVDDYYNPANSNLVYVLENKQGIPISLTCIYMLVGKRLGLPVEGCNFPGHFLARIQGPKGPVFVDCFGGGKFLDEQTIIQTNPELPDSIHDILHQNVNAETVIARVLYNLIRAYEQVNQKEDANLMIELLKSIEEEDMGS